MAKKLTRTDGEEVVVDRAIKDGTGNVIPDTYVKNSGVQDINGAFHFTTSNNISVANTGSADKVLISNEDITFNNGRANTSIKSGTATGNVELTLPITSGTLALTTDIHAPVDAYTKAESDGRYLQLDPASPQTVKADVTFADDTAGGNNSSITIRTNEGFPIITGTALGVDSQFLTALVLHGAGTLTENVTIQTPLQSGTIALTTDIPDVSGLATKAEVEAKQDELTSSQLSAVNSGITSAKVSTYDGYATQISGKQSDLGLTWEDYA